MNVLYLGAETNIITDIARRLMRKNTKFQKAISSATEKH